VLLQLLTEVRPARATGRGCTPYLFRCTGVGTYLGSPNVSLFALHERLEWTGPTQSPRQIPYLARM
jgi:hypothetical protein